MAQEQFAFVLAPDEGGQFRPVKRLEAAFDGTRPEDGPGSRRTRNSLEFYGPEVLQIVERAQQPSRAVSDDDAVRLGDPLQPRGEIRGVADDAALLGFSPPHEVAHDHGSRRDPDANAQRRTRRGLQLRHGVDDRQRGLDGKFRIAFVRLGIAEIGEHAVAQVFRDESAMAFDRLRAAPVVGGDDR